MIKRDIFFQDELLERLLKIMRRRQLSQVEVAREVGITISTISRFRNSAEYRQGMREVTLGKIEKWVEENEERS